MKFVAFGGNDIHRIKRVSAGDENVQRNRRLSYESEMDGSAAV